MSSLMAVQAQLKKKISIISKRWRVNPMVADLDLMEIVLRKYF